MSGLKIKQAVDINTADPRWRDLYKIGGVTSIIAAASVIFAIIAFFIWPYKAGFTSTANVFTILQKDLLGGLISLDILLLLIGLIQILPFLALYVTLKRVNESYALIALVLVLIAIASLIQSRPLAELVSLSGKYAAAASEVERNQYLAAGETLLSLFNGTAWMIQTVFLALSGLISSLLMLRSPFFGKTTAWIGIISSIIGLGFFIPVIGIPLLFINTIGGIIWLSLIARTFLRLGWDKSNTFRAA
jgi:hypothetical protein